MAILILINLITQREITRTPKMSQQFPWKRIYFY